MHLKRAPRLYKFDNFPAKECMFLPSQFLSFTHYPPDTSFVKLKALRESTHLSKPLLLCVKGNYDSSMWKILIDIFCLQLDLYTLPSLPEKSRNSECTAVIAFLHGSVHGGQHNVEQSPCSALSVSHF